MAQWTPQQLQQMAALLQGTHNNLAVDAALAGAPTQRWAVDDQGRRIDPIPMGSSGSATAAIEKAAPRPAQLPAPTMAFAPSGGVQPQMQQPQRVTGQMRRNPLFGTPINMMAQLLMGKGLPQQASSGARPLSPSQAYDARNQQARSTAIQRSSNPSGNSARASLASSWGFD